MNKNYFQQISHTKNLVEIFSQILEKELQNFRGKEDSFIIKSPPPFFLYYFLKKLSQGKEEAKQKRVILEFINQLKKNEIIIKRNLMLFKKIFFSLKNERFVLLFGLGIVSKVIPEFSKISF